MIQNPIESEDLNREQSKSNKIHQQVYCNAEFIRGGTGHEKIKLLKLYNCPIDKYLISGGLAHWTRYILSPTGPQKKRGEGAQAPVNDSLKSALLPEQMPVL